MILPPYCKYLANIVISVTHNSTREHSLDTPHEVPAMAAKLANLQAQKKFQLTAIGVGDDADMNVLQQLAPMTAKLKGTNFTDFFQWLSASVSVVSQSIPGDDRGVSIPPIEDWAVLKF